MYTVLAFISFLFIHFFSLDVVLSIYTLYFVFLYSSLSLFLLHLLFLALVKLLTLLHSVPFVLAAIFPLLNISFAWFFLFHSCCCFPCFNLDPSYISIFVVWSMSVSFIMCYFSFLPLIFPFHCTYSLSSLLYSLIISYTSIYLPLVVNLLLYCHCMLFLSIYAFSCSFSVAVCPLQYLILFSYHFVFTDVIIILAYILSYLSLVLTTQIFSSSLFSFVSCF